MQDEIGIREVMGEYRGRCSGAKSSLFLTSSAFGLLRVGETRQLPAARIAGPEGGDESEIGVRPN